MAQTQVYTDTIAAYFEDSSDARKAVDDLQKAGFTSAHLGIAHRGSYTGQSTTEGNSTVYETEEKGEGVSTWDKIKAWFSGTDAEPYADEPTGTNPAQQEIIPPANRFDEGYDDTSDLHGSFTAMNLPEDRARYFSHRFGRSSRGAVVTVQGGVRTAEAESILRRYNADFGENAGTYDYSQQGAYAGEITDRQERQTESPRNVQLLGEVLRVHRNRLDRGQALTRKEVVREQTIVDDADEREHSA